MPQIQYDVEFDPKNNIKYTATVSVNVERGIFLNYSESRIILENE